MGTHIHTSMEGMKKYGPYGWQPMKNTHWVSLNKLSEIEKELLAV